MNKASFELRGKTHHLQAPASWNEVSFAQLQAWLVVLQSAMPDSDKLKLAVPVFYEMKPALLARFPESLRVQLAAALRFLSEKNQLDRWLAPKLKLNWLTTLYGPADKLSNLTAHEFFNYTELLYWQYKTTLDVGALDALIAVLYREKRVAGVNNDIRVPLTDAGVAKRAKMVAKLPLIVKISVLFNYEGCRNFITAAHKKAFSSKGKPSKKRFDITLSLSGGPLGDLRYTRAVNIYDFLAHLENLIEREENLKKAS
ncbi:hypothetical protein [Mucilaginibacter sp. CSA2-8R]|uniref:hypothetical protein n=1 Tax=Mucilaginibacter sp. CSA2-8R TaxID=3141542 RepID=UPI00315C9D0B